MIAVRKPPASRPAAPRKHASNQICLTQSRRSILLFRRARIALHSRGGPFLRGTLAAGTPSQPPKRYGGVLSCLRASRSYPKRATPSYPKSELMMGVWRERSLQKAISNPALHDESRLVGRFPAVTQGPHSQKQGETIPPEPLHCHVGRSAT